MTATSVPTHPGPTGMALWKTAQWIGVLATVALLVVMVTDADLALSILWNVLIPLVPASLLVSPAIWRNVCPLATLNLLSNRASVNRVLPVEWLPRAGLVGIVLLVLMVPARRFVFNTDGLVLAITVALVAVLAMGLGTLFQVKAGFCNAICPVLPVERLYGQHPLLDVGNPRCVPCTHCTVKGCIDLTPRKSIAQTLGAARRSHEWLTTGYGVFAAAFPGFVVGYYTTQDVAFSMAGSIYLHVALWSFGSYLVTALIVRALNMTASLAMVLLAGAAAGLYYWYAGSVIATAFGWPGTSTAVLRAVGLTLVALWLFRAVPHGAAGNGNAHATA